MMSSLLLQVGPSYGFSRAVEDTWIREFERSQAETVEFAVDEASEASAERERPIERPSAWLTRLAHAITFLNIRPRHA